MNKYKSYGKGWHQESYRHSLAAKGIKTSFASESAYMDLLDSINKIYPEHDSDEQFELFGDWNRDYLTGSKAYGSLSFAPKDKFSMAFKEDFEAEFKRRYGVGYRVRVEKLLEQLKEDYAKRLLRLREIQTQSQRKFTGEGGVVLLESEKLPNELRSDQMEKLRVDIDELEMELHPTKLKEREELQSVIPVGFGEEKAKIEFYYSPSIRERVSGIKFKKTPEPTKKDVQKLIKQTEV
jgi:hypothetical protein